MRVSLVVHSVAALAAIAAGLVIPSAAAAQDARGYVGGGVAISPWSPESISSGASLSFDNTTEDDWAPAVQVEAGAFVSRHVGVGLEFALAARREVEQRYYYTAPYIAKIHYREAPLFGVIRLHPGGRPTGVAFVAGAGLVHQDGFERRASRIGFTGTTYGPFGPEVQTSRWTWGAAAGVDAALPLGSGMTLVPQIRAVFVERGETYESDEFADLGFRAVSYRLALALRANF